MTPCRGERTDESVAADQGVEWVLVAALVLEGSPRAGGEDEEHVLSLAAAETELPPITVHRATMRVIDGAHRVRAARLAAREHIRARYFDGSADDAFVLAVQANIGHGLPLSLKDRLAAATRIVATHARWSDRMIASAVGVSARTIAELRARNGDGNPAARVGQDGRARPVDGAQRRSLASALLTENPDLSLRQVAQVAGISPETVRAVRNRLVYGRADPPAERGKPQSRQEDLSSQEMLRRLAADPTVRHTDTGRTLLRVLRAQAMAAHQWAEIIDNVPAHCAELVVRAARDSARMWGEVATRVAERMSAVD